MVEKRLEISLLDTQDGLWGIEVKGGPASASGPGSGHHGHAGRPGEVGGSVPSGTAVRPSAEREPMKIGTMARDLFRRIHEDEGFTYQPRYDDSPTKGFAVSIFKDDEEPFGIDRAMTIEDDDGPKDITRLSWQDISEYIYERRERFNDPTVHVGGWHDTETGVVWIDLSVVLQDKQEAIRLAIKHKQEGIYDLENFVTIIVKEEEDRRREIDTKAPD